MTIPPIPQQMIDNACSYLSMSRTTTLLDVMPDPTTNNGVFAYLSTLPYIEPESNNMEYLFNRSGSKVPSALVTRLADGDTLTQVSLASLARIIAVRFANKWNRMWEDYSSTSPLFNNVDITTTTTYGKSTITTGTDNLTKSGTETHTKSGKEIEDNTFPENLKSVRTISGGWKDGSNLKQTRTGTEDVTESYPEVRTSTTEVTGGYKDTDSTATTRTGSQTVTDKGDILASSFGFNSSTAVPVSKTGPADTSTSQETSYNNLADTKSGDTTRTYNDYKETTTERGTKKTSTTYGENGMVDMSDGSESREYQDYKDEVTESGSRRKEVTYSNLSDTHEYNSRTDNRTTSSSASNSGMDSVHQYGYNIRRITDKLDIVSATYNDPMLLNFFEIVYRDIDEVLTIPYFA